MGLVLANLGLFVQSYSAQAPGFSVNLNFSRKIYVFGADYLLNIGCQSDGRRNPSLGDKL